ncbi:MAG TPA: hypothetical protein VM716_06950 [Gemmatimonadales bacterium]|nr:hypothetical protein [Gemmatimonadales bacterium]
MKTTYFALAIAGLAVAACNEPNEPNLNGPNVSDFSTITTLAQVQDLVTGVLRGDRVQAENEIIEGEIMGRDLFNLTSSEFRWETQLLGPGIDPSGFLGNRIWPFANIRLANIGISGVSAAAASLLNAQDKPATLGFLRTIKGLEYLRAVETRDTAGAPIDVGADPLAPPAPLRCKHDVLNYIAALLDSGAVNLAAGGSSFPFTVPADFVGFDSPAGFLTFNRALAAKTFVYLAFRNYASGGIPDVVALDSANAALAGSFMVASSALLNLGPAHDYSTSTGDAQNTLFSGSPSNTTYFVNPLVLSEADPGDLRVKQKTDSAQSPTTVAGAASNGTVYLLYLSPTSPTKIITNKELLLLQAEVNWGLGGLANDTKALAEADSVRKWDGGLATDTTAATDVPGILNRILYEKRYSLLFQGADRWLDARLFGKLNGARPPAGIDSVRAYPPVQNVPLPFNEQSARGGNLAQTCTSGP